MITPVYRQGDKGDRGVSSVAEARRSFSEELERIAKDVVRLGSMTAETIPRGTEVLLKGDLLLAQQLIDEDDEIDALAVEIEDHCYHVLALQQPMAGDMRAIVTAIRLSSEFERDADLMVNVCKAARRLFGVDLPPTVRRYIEEMAEEALRLTRLAVEAYANRDESVAAALDDIDDRLDELHADYIQAVFEAHQRSEIDLPSAVQLALVGRYYERIGDHAVNVGERIRYMVSGWLPEHTGMARMRLRSDSTAGSLAGRPASETGDGESGSAADDGSPGLPSLDTGTDDPPSETSSNS
ncbi:MAG: hypothetical protein KatS3mg008_1027 [Acidimicrobiales bacterium]|nr:MAG: hypothetical protein KatS3mg008_1027 [Acidimicrobiales bacterium]